MISIDHISSNDVKLFSIKSENTNNIVNDTVSDGVNEGVNDGVNEGVSDIGVDDEVIIENTTNVVNDGIFIDDDGIYSENYNLEDSTKTKRKKT
jgi:formaldehyde-activating enzyme involved in methanogenesis